MVCVTMEQVHGDGLCYREETNIRRFVTQAKFSSDLLNLEAKDNSMGFISVGVNRQPVGVAVYANETGSADLRQVSSKTSLITASVMDSPGSIIPPGRHH